MTHWMVLQADNFKRAATISVISIVLQSGAIRRAPAEERIDLKTLIYQEDDDRIQVIARSVEYEKEFDSGLSLRVEGTYNAISGATPTGAPPYEEVVRMEVIPVALPAAPRYIDDDDDSDGDSDYGGAVSATTLQAPSVQSAPSVNGVAAPTAVNPPLAVSAATPAPPSSGGSGSSGGGGVGYRTREVREWVPTDKVPKADIDDTRMGLNFEIGKRWGRHKTSLLMALSVESDYTSVGLSVKELIDFNNRNTTLLLGLGGTFDQVDGIALDREESKNSYEAIAGITQVLDRKTLATLNVTVGTADGYLSDPYKYTFIDWVLVPERRPDSRDKLVLYGAVTRYVESLRGSAEVSLRYYDDSFGISSETVGLAWYQKIGEHLILRPSVRFYTQTAADFYDVMFSGDPEYYSSDYRVSAFDSIGYGLKLIIKPNDRMAFDVAFERYGQDGTDGVTIDDAYITANYLILGYRLWL